MGKTIGVILALNNKFSPQLKKIAHDLGTTEAKLKKAQASVEKLQKATGEKMRKAATVFAGACTAIAAASAVVVNKTLEAGDRVDKMSQKVGMSRKTFQELDYVFSQCGLKIDSFTTGAKKLSEAVYNVNKKNSESAAIFRNLGVSVKDSRGKFLSQEVVLKKTLAALQKMPQGVNKAVYAQKLFGKQGLELMPLLNSQSKGIDELIKKCHSLGMVMSDEQVDAAVKMTDTFDTLKRSIAPISLMFGNMLIPKIQEFSDTIINNMPQIQKAAKNGIEKLGNAINFVCDNMDTLIPTAGALLVAIIAFKTTSGAISFFVNLSKVIELCVAANASLNIVMWACPIMLIAGSIALLVGGLVLCYNKFEGFRSVVNATWSVLKLLGNNFIFTCQAIWQAISPVVMFTAKIVSLLSPLRLAVELVKKLGGFKGTADGVKNWADTKNAQLDEYAKTTGVRHKALGTSYFAGGLTSINEQNRGEIVDLPSGTRITPHDVAVKQASKPVAITVPVTVQGNVLGNTEFLNQLVETLVKRLRVELARI